MNKQNSTVSTLALTPDGHIVGADGFIVPKDFGEFDSRYPRYVQGFVRRRLVNESDLIVDAKVLDLKRHLLTPRHDSTQDRIAEFTGKNGATAAHFFSYLNLVLAIRPVAIAA